MNTVLNHKKSIKQSDPDRMNRKNSRVNFEVTTGKLARNMPPYKG